MKNDKNPVYQKHLTLIDREDIEKLLKEGFKLHQIAERVRKETSTISKEIKRNKIEYHSSGFNNSHNYCKYKNTCKLQNVCEANCHTECRRCKKCNDVCQSYELDMCERLLKPPYVCNSCNGYGNCKKIKYLYVAGEAQKKYEKNLKSSREGINLTEEQLKKLDDLVSPLIKQGQSVKLIYVNHKDEIPCSERCLYNYIELNLLTAKNIDLQRRVRFKVRDKKKNKENAKKDYSYRIGRTYEDFKKLLNQEPNIVVVEMDTVEGVKGGKCLLTLLFRNCNFMIAKLLPDKESKSVKKAFDGIEKAIGTEIFKRIFKCILTDNGGEFRRPEELELSINGTDKRCNVYYCEANRSDEKGKIEKNHEYIRYIIPKGKSMDSYGQELINLMMSHINSVARELLNFATPYDMAKVYLGMDTIKKFGISKIQPDNIILKPQLINKKK